MLTSILQANVTMRDSGGCHAKEKFFLNKMLLLGIFRQEFCHLM